MVTGNDERTFEMYLGLLKMCFVHLYIMSYAFTWIQAEEGMAGRQNQNTHDDILLW